MLCLIEPDCPHHESRFLCHEYADLVHKRVLATYVVGYFWSDFFPLLFLFSYKEKRGGTLNCALWMIVFSLYI